MSGIQLGLARNVSLCCDMGLVGKYPKYIPKYSKYLTDYHQEKMTHLTSAEMGADSAKSQVDTYQKKMMVC